MAVFNPGIPTAINFKPGTYPQRSYRSLSGVVTKRTFGNAPSQATLEMSFDNIPDITANSIISHYHSQTTQNQRFKLGTPILNLSTALNTLEVGYDSNLRWEYANPPEVTLVRPGITNVSVSLIGEIRDPRSDDE